MYTGVRSVLVHRWYKVLHKLLLLPSPTSRAMRERQQLLVGCGFTWKAEAYLTGKRILP